MKLPRDISGRALVKALCRDWGYQQVHQVGSHIILQTYAPVAHRVAVPDHTPLRLGTFHGILRAWPRPRAWSGRLSLNRYSF